MPRSGSQGCGTGGAPLRVRLPSTHGHIWKAGLTLPIATSNSSSLVLRLEWRDEPAVPLPAVPLPAVPSSESADHDEPDQDCQPCHCQLLLTIQSSGRQCSCPEEEEPPMSAASSSMAARTKRAKRRSNLCLGRARGGLHVF